jgi:hypothetical protein
MFVVFFLHNKNNVFSLSFHHLLTILLFPLQVYVSTSAYFDVCFCNFYFCQMLLHSFVVKFILVSYFFLFLHNGCCYNEESYISCCGG